MREDLRQQISAIANRFHLFECTQCALAIREFLERNTIPGKAITLFTGSTKEPFCNIYHEQRQENISTNGRHQAIAVDIDGQELIFDNIHPMGISRVDWLNNFYCPTQDLGADFNITETEF